VHILINDQQIIGVDKYIIKALISATCDRCTHKTTAHREDGCKVTFVEGTDPCPCKKGYTSYLLLNDDSFRQEIIKEGLLF